MMTPIKSLILIVSFILFPVNTIDASSTSPTDIQTDYTTVSVSETAERSVETDRFFAKLSFQVQERSAAKAQDVLNAKIASILPQLKNLKALTLTTGQYRVFQRHSDKKWEASQAIHLDSASKEPLLKAVEAMQQEGLAVNELKSYLSKDVQNQTAELLTKEALQTLKLKSKKLANTLEKKTTHLSRIRIHSQSYAQPRNRDYGGYKLSAHSESAMPSIESGLEQVRVVVDADILLR